MATRELSAYVNSTPTYIFRITDAASSGVDIASLGVMMVIKFGETNFKYRYLTSVRSRMLSITESEYWCDPSYCRNLGGGSFAVTVPLWKLQAEPSLDSSMISYQVFLYSTGVLTTPGLQAIGADGGIVITPGLVAYHNILIDEGTISLLSSTFPKLVDAEIKLIEALGADALSDFVEVFGPLSQTSPVSAPKAPASITDDFGDLLVDLLATKDLTTIDSSIVAPEVITNLLARTTKTNELSSAQFNELFGVTADAVYKYSVSKVKPV